jgi:peptidoglycan/xylan/chitin deacetylase (PgdA/CDA1 family)
MKEILFRLVKAAGGFALARGRTQRDLRILAYHGVWTTPGFQYGDRLFIPPQQFEQRMAWLKRSRYPVLPLGEALARLATQTLPANAVVITIDDGWRSTYTHMLPVLESLGLPATAYVTTWYVVNRAPVLNVALNYVLQRAPNKRFEWESPVAGRLAVDLSSEAARERALTALGAALEQLPSLADRLREFREICRLAAVPTEPWWSEGQFHLMTFAELRDASARGLDIQLHTHRHRNVANQNFVLDRELADNRAVLSEACAGAELGHFCYPSGIVDRRAAAVLAAAGIRSAATCEIGLNPPGTDRYALRRFLDGRSVGPTGFEAYLSGASDMLDKARALLPRFARRPI